MTKKKKKRGISLNKTKGIESATRQSLFKYRPLQPELKTETMSSRGLSKVIKSWSWKDPVLARLAHLFSSRKQWQIQIWWKRVINCLQSSTRVEFDKLGWCCLVNNSTIDLASSSASTTRNLWKDIILAHHVGPKVLLWSLMLSLFSWQNWRPKSHSHLTLDHHHLQSPSSLQSHLCLISSIHYPAFPTSPF